MKNITTIVRFNVLGLLHTMQENLNNLSQIPDSCSFVDSSQNNKTCSTAILFDMNEEIFLEAAHIDLNNKILAETLFVVDIHLFI